MKYWVESSYDHDDKEKEYPECLVVCADYGWHGTESIGHISLPEGVNGGYCPTLKSELIDVVKRIQEDGKALMVPIEDEISNFLLWYFRQNSNEAKGLAKELYDGLNAYIDEENLYKGEQGGSDGRNS